MVEKVGNAAYFSFLAFFLIFLFPKLFSKAFVIKAVKTWNMWYKVKKNGTRAINKCDE